MDSVGERIGVDVNPARAGMIRWDRAQENFGSSKPRASGDDPRLAVAAYPADRVNPARAGMIHRVPALIVGSPR